MSDGTSGQATYSSAGTFNWTAPSGCTSVCVVAVGAGGNEGTAAGDGGGGLGWKNNITVSPGQQYTVKVGGRIGGTQGHGDESWFINNTTVCGEGGDMGGSITGGQGGGYTGDGGGNGGNGGAANGNRGGGGGAGGYAGAGGAGGDGINSGASNGSDGSGGGGGGAGGASWEGGAGGGVGLLGQGSNGPGCPGTYQGTAGQAYAHLSLIHI